MVVTRLPKNDGPPSMARHPLCFGAVFLLFFGFLAGADDMRESIQKNTRFCYTGKMVLIEYKKAFLKYAPIESLVAGLELTGQEVKSLRNKLGSMDGSRVVVRGGEAFIVGMTIPAYQVANAPKSYDPERARRLLLTKKEITGLYAAEAKRGLTIIPLEVYTNKTLLKARIAIVRGKKKEDRREDLKKRDALRETGRVLKNR